MEEDMRTTLVLTTVLAMLIAVGATANAEQQFPA
jgi:hypothetical protein